MISHNVEPLFSLRSFAVRDRLPAMRRWVRGLFGNGPAGLDHERLEFPIELRAVKSAPDTAGGILSGDQLVENIDFLLTDESPIRALADVQQAERGKGTATWPTCDDTDNDADLVDELDTVTPAGMTFGGKVFRPVKLIARATVSEDLLEDLLPGGEEQLLDALFRRVGRKADALYANGVSSGESIRQGLTEQCTVGATAAAATAIALSDLWNLVAAVPSAYRRRGRFIMSSQVWKHVSTSIVDGNGAPLFAQVFGPWLENGLPILSDSLPGTIEAGAKCIVFGDVRQIKVFDFGDLVLTKLTELAAATDEAILSASLRTAMMVLQPTALQVLQQAAS